MLSKKQWTLLLSVYTIYVLVGASIFHFIESKEENERVHSEKMERREIERMLEHCYNKSEVSIVKLMKRLTEYCGKPLDFNMSEQDYPRKWDYYHAVFFVITVVSTIGYGNLAPTTMFTRIFMIFYGLIGIPIQGIVMVSFGDVFGRSFTKLYKRWKTVKMESDTTKLGLIAQIILYLVPGFTFFIFLPATVITIFEGWEYDVSVYYAFVTLTTIGFGDYVAGGENINGFAQLTHNIYKSFLLIWVVGGLGYVVMVLGFISQGMRSKKMAQFEHLITENIKKTPHKIRNELRTLLQEFLFLRVKPVYKFEYEPVKIERAHSCPELFLIKDDTPTMLRKRAMSDSHEPTLFTRINSDSELDKIDKELTFRPSIAFMQQKDLLLKVVDALSYKSVETEEDGGQDLFSAKEILAGETYGSNGTISGYSGYVPPSQRRRAVSDIRPPTLGVLKEQKTWSGEEAQRKLKEFRGRTMSMPSEELKEQTSIFKRIRDRFRKESKDQDVEKAQDSKSKEAMFSPAELSYINRTNRGRASVLSARQEAVLEETSIADFIRALTAIAVPESLEVDNKRKTGFAGATPPTPGQRTRRNPIPTSARRSSLMPSSSHYNFNRRRLSLRPLEENEAPPPPYSLIEDLQLSRASSARNHKVSLSNPSGQGINTGQRKFSVRRVSLAPGTSAGPVQRQVFKRERDDSNGDKQ